MGAVGNVIIFVCISVCVYLLVFYKGQTVPYVLLPDEETEKMIRIYITIAFGFKVRRRDNLLNLIKIKDFDMLCRI